jgi:ketosteroid isomerase-like protein
VTHVALENRFFNALLAADHDALDAVFAEDAVFWQNFLGREIPKAEFLPRFAGLANRVPDLRFEDVRRAGTPDGFVEQHTLAGTAPSGEPFAVRGCFIVTVRDGRIVRLNEYLDSAQLAPLRRP